MSIKSRLDKLERAAGAGDDPVIMIVRWEHGEQPPEDMTHESEAGGVTVRTYGDTTIPEHLQAGPGPITRIVENRAPIAGVG